jgi:hypothetical protein
MSKTRAMKGAIISECRRYRYLLWRRWSKGLPMVVIGLNPSTADDNNDDPTSRRLIRFAKEYGFCGLDLVNLFAFRATKPKALSDVEDPVGQDNDKRILETCNSTNTIVAAWGNGGTLFGRDGDVMKLLNENGIDLKCFGKTNTGCPKHPLYLAARTRLVDYP